MKFINDSLLSGAKTQAYRSSCIQSQSAYTTLVFLDRGLYVEALLLLSLYRQTTPNPPLSKPPQVPRAITSLLLQHPQRPHIGQPKHWIMQIKGFFAAEDLRNHFAVCIKMGLESDSSISLTTRFKNLRSFKFNFEDCWRKCWPKEKSTEQGGAPWSIVRCEDCITFRSQSCDLESRYSWHLESYL